MSELQLIRSSQGEWTGEHRLWASPMSPDRSPSQAVVPSLKINTVCGLRHAPEDRAGYGAAHAPPEQGRRPRSEVTLITGPVRIHPEL